jgi:Cdc6-like AAA superfamily ATPase
MSEYDDAAEWAKASDEYKPSQKSLLKSALHAITSPSSDEEDDELTPGLPNQYQLYGPGFKPANSTVKTLPAGCYDITADQTGVFVVPTPAPTGLLLELPEMRSEEVINQVEKFWASEKDYKDGNEFVIGGAAFKAGIMLYGPPGTGKSCTIKIVSRKLVEKGGTVFFASSNPGFLMNFLANFSVIEPNRKCIVILEDIDSLIYQWGEATYLELLDSAKSIDNVLFIATTNYPEKLDPRVYNRPGRFSHVVKIGVPSRAAREAYLKAILKNYRDVDYIVDNSQGFSIDHLTALINAVYREKKDLGSEIKRLRTLFKVPLAEEEKRMGIGNDE